MARISKTFANLKEQSRKALIPFVTAGDPVPELTVPLMHAMVKAGADIIELGVPFSDPMADGPAIQRSSERAIKSGVGLQNVLQYVTEFRRSDATTPVVLMGYANPIEHMGYEVFARAAKASGVDGVLVVDYPPEEGGALFDQLAKQELAAICLLAPTSNAARIAVVAKVARGYVYYVSLKGVTGAANIDLGEVAAKLPAIKNATNLPVGVGFGIRDAATAKAVAGIADAVVIGSRIIQEIEQSSHANVLENVGKLLSEIRVAMDSINK
ncbi:MAG: tryptophan synthase subunit alpha [Burkholderiales bacterium]